MTDKDETQKKYDSIYEKLNSKKNTNLNRTHSVQGITFGFLPFFPVKSYWCSTIKYDKDQEQYNAYTKLVSPEEGNEDFDYQKRVVEEYVDEKGKKKKIKVTHGRGFNLFTAKKLSENSTYFSYMFGIKIIN
jgi:hypothetical protein